MSMVKSKVVLWFLYIAIAIALAAIATVRLAQKDANPSAILKVKKAVSGDTVKLKADQKLVYLGINAPEENEPFFEQAKQKNHDLVAGKKIRLVYEDKKRNHKYRLLAYAFLKDGTFVNVELLKAGLARVQLHPEITQFREELKLAEEEARKAKRGIWGQ